MLVLGKNHFEEQLTCSFICSLARLASLPARKWSKELIKVREEGKKDEAYQRAQQEVASKDKEVKEQVLEIREKLLY